MSSSFNNNNTEPEGPDASSSLASPKAGTKSRHQANKQYLMEKHQVAEILNDMVTHLVCTKPQDELDALIRLLEQRQDGTTDDENGEKNNNTSNNEKSTNEFHHLQSTGDVLEQSMRQAKKEKDRAKQLAQQEKEEKEKKEAAAAAAAALVQAHHQPSPPSSNSLRGSGGEQQPFQRRNIINNNSTATTQQQDSSNTGPVLSLTAQLDSYFAKNNNTNEEESLFDIVAEFCKNDDILFNELIFQSSDDNNKNRITKENFVQSIIDSKIGSSSNNNMLSVATRALTNNETMLRNVLLLTSHELGVEKCLTLVGTVSTEQLLGSSSLPPSEKAIIVLLSNLEKRIARTCAVKKLVEDIVKNNDNNTNQNKNYDYLLNTIFFQDQEQETSTSSSSSVDVAKLSTSTEIELLLSEFICNAQLAVKVLQESAASKDNNNSSNNNNNNNHNGESENNNNNNDIAKWIQQSLESIETATRLQEQNRKVLMMMTMTAGEGNDDDVPSSRTDKDESISNTLAEVSPSASVVIAVSSIRDFVNKGRGFVREWIRASDRRNGSKSLFGEV